MHFPFLHPAKNIVNESSDGTEDQPPAVVIHEHFENTNEGSEFIDDALRMEDVILPRTEESIAPGNPGHLL